jgi:hypothetical protein
MKDNKKPWWHKKWDNKIKIAQMNDFCIETPKYALRWNDIAKQTIQEIIDVELKEQLRKYNLYANAKNKTLDNPFEDEYNIEKLVKFFQYKSDRYIEIYKELQQLKKVVKLSTKDKI